jgi:hypothetical protein
MAGYDDDGEDLQCRSSSPIVVFIQFVCLCRATSTAQHDRAGASLDLTHSGSQKPIEEGYQELWL